MIDLKLLRDDPERVRASQIARGDDPGLVDALVAADGERRAAVTHADTLRGEQKAASQGVRGASPAERPALLAKANQLQAQRQPIFNETVLKPYINSLKLGDVNLVSEKGSIIIPPAGIQGRTVQLFAPKIDFQGGAVVGNVVIPPTVNVSGPPNVVGTGSGAVTPPVSPVSGSSASASVSATTAAVSTSAKSTENVQEAASEGSAKQSEASAKQVASNKGNEKDKKKLAAQSVRIKRGVVIQVDVKPQAQPGS